MTDLLRCPSCNMTFRSSLLLEKHREKFCIGGNIGRVRETQTPQEMVSKVKNSRRRNNGQMEHRDVKQTNDPKITISEYILNSREDKADLAKINGSTRLEPKATDSELQLRYLAEAHSKQINEIMSQNKVLEKQRDDIVQRLNEITAQSRNTGYLEKMIRHLNAQEQKNEQLLTTMKQQIDLLQAESLKRELVSRHSESPASRKIAKGSLTFQMPFIPFYGGGSLSSEISALRMSYLQSGGNDPMILAHLQDLLAEAQLTEQREKQARSNRKKTKKGYGATKWHLNEKLITLEIENQQLEDELFKLQLQRQKINRLPKTTIGDVKKPLQFPKFMKEPTYQNINTLNAELEVLKQELEIQKLKRRIKTSVTRRPKSQLDALIPLEMNKPEPIDLAKQYLNFSHGLEPAPYDPVAGFVVFYDFLLGLDPSYRVCRLALSLCSGGQEFGSPSMLPPVYCESSLSRIYDNKQNIAILATKQVVPRARPSPNLSLIIELQASGGYDPYGQEVSRLIPRGWVKLDLFDCQNRVVSGHWKIPIRILPVKPSLTTGALNGVPQLDSAELYIRLVNARDADVQSSYPIDFNNLVFYKYPPLGYTMLRRIYKVYNSKIGSDSDLQKGEHFHCLRAGNVCKPWGCSFCAVKGQEAHKCNEAPVYMHPEEGTLSSPYYTSPYFFPNMQHVYVDNVDSPPSRQTLMTQ